MGTTEWVKGLPEKLPEKVAEDGTVKFKEFHVLAVDDSFVDRKVIERLLKISACKVTLVDSGESALQFLGPGGEDDSSAKTDNMDVNLIMTDYSMPGMTGYELLKKIKESSAFKEIPVVIMSSENILDRIARCLKEGAEDFLLKPVQLSDVKRLKEFILRGQGAEQEQSSSPPPSSPDSDPSSCTPCSLPLPPLKRLRLQQSDS